MHIVHPVIKALSRCIFELVKQIDVNVIDGFVFRPVGSRLKSVFYLSWFRHHANDQRIYVLNDLWVTAFYLRK